MNLLRVIKSASLVIGCVMMVSGLYSMDQAKFISRKESKFDFLTLGQLGVWYGKLPRGNKVEIEKRVKRESKQRLTLGKKDKNRALFNFVTQLPEDVQNIVLAHMLNRKLGAAKIFYDMPLSNAFNCYGRAVKMLEWKDQNTEFNRRLSKKSSFTLDVVFENLNDLMVFARTLEKQDGAIYSYKELKPIAKLAQVFGFYSIKCDQNSYAYNHHLPYTLDSFKNQYSREQLSFLPFLLAPFVSRLIAKDYIYKGFKQSIIDSNRAAHRFNQKLAEKVKNIEDSFWSSYIKPIEETYGDLPDGLILLKKGLVYWSALPISFPLFWKTLKEPDREFGDGFKTMCVVGCIPGIVTWIVKSIALYTMPTLVESLLEKPFMGMVCVTGLYALIVSLYNVKKMRDIRSQKVSLADLSELLKRTDIVIE